MRRRVALCSLYLRARARSLSLTLYLPLSLSLAQTHCVSHHAHSLVLSLARSLTLSRSIDRSLSRSNTLCLALRTLSLARWLAGVDAKNPRNKGNALYISSG